jgi:hypothetical protein
MAKLIFEIFIFSTLITFLFASSAPTACDDELTIVKNEMAKYLSGAYNPPQVDLFDKFLNSVRGSIDATYLLCFNDPAHHITQEFTPFNQNCLISIRNVSTMAKKYIPLGEAKIKSDIKFINDIVYQALADCDAILNGPKQSTISDKCKESADGINALLTKYTDSRVIGKPGTEFLSDIAIALEKERRDCDIRPVAKPETNKEDNCNDSNEFFGYVADHMESLLDKKDYNGYLSYYNFYYQAAIRAARVCSSQKLNFLES